ncbi:MAG: hypothetical protein WA943_14340 [Parvibaculum sp.]|jgi:hypothetical protein|uniref:hypothetical protein n=1 Tax=Parvibaculum sp. TaxID=2024848 RepID=UPI003C777DB5
MSLILRLVERLRGRLAEPEQRLAARSSDPLLLVEIGGYDHRARDWSAGGACIEGFAGETAIGDILCGSLRWHRQTKGRNFTAEVMRIEQGGVVALRWLALPDAILAEMEPDEG